MTVLPRGSPDRDIFVAAHQTLGVTVLCLILLRLIWLSSSAPPALSPDLKPWERFLARALHLLIYAAVIGLPVSGILLSFSQAGGHIDLYGWILRTPSERLNEDRSLRVLLHDKILSWLFYVAIANHLAAVLKHHFISMRLRDVRRMLR